jgi:hypothetical protein
VWWSRTVGGNGPTRGDGVRHCGFGSVLPRGFERAVVPGRDYVLGPVPSCRIGIRRSFGSGKLGGLTYGLLRVRKEGATS